MKLRVTRETRLLHFMMNIDIIKIRGVYAHKFISAFYFHLTLGCVRFVCQNTEIPNLERG